MRIEQKNKTKKNDADIEIDEKGRKPEENSTETGLKEAHDSRLQRFLNWYKANKEKSIPLSIVALLLLLAALPWTRYPLAGLVYKKDFVVKITDATTSAPVSGALVKSGNISTETNNSGLATLHRLKAGAHGLLITKKYYKDSQVTVLVPIFKQKTTPTLQFVATGRQVKISTKNLISHAVLADVNIKIADISAKTDKSGSAIVVVPAGTKSTIAVLSANGYNDASVTVNVSDQTIQENDFNLTPKGTAYFLSKLSGKIDVVKTNLDGSGRQTVLAGTGQEDNNNTVLLASRDWKFLALLSRRAGNSSSLYLIDTADDKLTNIDQGDANFTPVGWSNHYFVYTVARNGYSSWEPNAFSIKSYNADAGRGLTLFNSQATGTSNYDAEYQNVWDTLIMGNDIIYTTTWNQYYGYRLVVNGQQNTLSAIHADGTNSRQLKSVDAGNSYFTTLRLNKPKELYFGIYDNTTQNTTFYILDKNGNINQNSNVVQQGLANPPTTYLQSPSGDSTFWNESRDGKNTLLVGDQNGDNGKQVATLSDYSAYGWYTDDYLLVSKGGSELYIMPKAGPDSQAVKITDYHKPQVNYPGYGSGYGGL